MMVFHLDPPAIKTHPEAEWISTCSDIAFKVPDLWQKMEKENKDGHGKKVCTVGTWIEGAGEMRTICRTDDILQTLHLTPRIIQQGSRWKPCYFLLLL